MEKVERAIILAAGIGMRMKPITNTIPKPLIKIKGKPMIESIIESLIKNKIYEIHVVIGHLSEQFEYLKSKYKNVHLLYNPYYNEANNIASLYIAREYLHNVIILDGDQIIFNDKLLDNSLPYSGYCATWNDSYTKEWMLTVENNSIIGCNRNGGEQGWQLYSVSRWNSEDGERLKKYIEIEFEQKHNFNIYWDDVALFCYPDKFRLGIYKINKEDIIEIDSYEELCQIDSSYQ